MSLRDVQEFARHADPRTTIRYDRARKSLDRNATYTIAQYLAWRIMTNGNAAGVVNWLSTER